ncbi:MAG: RidA family protein [Candidatus Helarchaeota archaeon]
MNKETIIAKNGAPPVGPYSPGIKMGNWFFTSGQGPFDPTSQTVPEDFKEQVRVTLENIKNLVEAAGGTIDNVVKTTVFLKDINNFNKMNRIYKKYFTKNPPARTCVEVARLPLDIQIEIEAIAYIP